MGQLQNVRIERPAADAAVIEFTGEHDLRGADGFKACSSRWSRKTLSSLPTSPRLSSWTPQCSGLSFAPTLLRSPVGAASGCSWVPHWWWNERSNFWGFSITSVAGSPETRH